MKTVRVEIETADGMVGTLTGEAADLYQRQVDHAGSMAAVHGSQFVALPWVNTPARLAALQAAVKDAAMAYYRHGYITNTCSDLHAACAALAKAEGEGQ